MATTDGNGNKLPQSRMSKKDFGRVTRNCRIELKNSNYCNMCGFKVCGENHKSGQHHQQAPKVIEERLRKSVKE